MKKTNKIIGELVKYMTAAGSDYYRIDVRRLDNAFLVEFFSNFDPQCRAAIDKLESFAHAKRNLGLEETFWQLAGAGSDDGEISLVFQMVDESHIEIENNSVKIVFKKEF